MRWLLRSLVFAVLVGGASLALAFSGGPPASKTGAPAIGAIPAELSCTQCHSSFPLNAPGATIVFENMPTTYLPNQFYTFNLKFSSTFAVPRRWGFQVTAVRADNGQGIGTFDTTPMPTLTQIVAGTSSWSSRKYVEHTMLGTYDNNLGPVTWSIRWQAPSSNVGRIFFFAAGNAANSSDSNTGDHIYTIRDTLDPDPLLGVGDPPIATLDALGAPRPNPFRSNAAFAYTLARDGDVDLGVFDALGRRVRTLVSGARPAGAANATWDGRDDAGAPAAGGVYFVRLRTTHERAPVTRKVTLER